MANINSNVTPIRVQAHDRSADHPRMAGQLPPHSVLPQLSSVDKVGHKGKHPLAGGPSSRFLAVMFAIIVLAVLLLGLAFTA